MQQRPFVLFWLARLASTMGYQMLALTIGWQVYEITDSAFDLGLVGLIQFVPAVVLTLLIGHAADRYDRRLIVRAAHSVYALAAIMITAALLAGALSRDLLFAAVFMHRLRARVRNADRACAGADAGAVGLISARGRGLDLGQPDRGDLRPGARRPDLCAQPGAGRRRLSRYFLPARSRWSVSSASQGPAPRARAADIRFGAGRL